jgi:hypothetical protein
MGLHRSRAPSHIRVHVGMPFGAFGGHLFNRFGKNLAIDL